MRVATRLSLLALGLALALGFSNSMTRADDAPATAPKATGTISGKVVDSAGKAVSGVTVNAIAAADAPAAGGGRAAGGGGAANRPKPLATATTGDDGTYKLDAVPVGKVVLMARLQGTGNGRSAAPVEVTDGKDTKADDIKLVARGAGGRRGGGAAGGAAGGAGN